MLKSVLCALIIALPVTGAQAQQTPAQTKAASFVKQCAAHTHSRGQFALDFGGAIPQVVAVSGATARGVRNVNDCLKDKYQTQPGLVTAARTAPIRQAGNEDICARLANRSVGESVVLAAGSALVGGIIGAGIHGGVLANNHAKCQTTLTAQPVSDGPFEIYRCGRQHSVLQGGTGYCKR